MMQTRTVSFIPASKLFADYPKACELFNEAFPYTFGDGYHTLHTAHTITKCLFSTYTIDPDEKAQVEAVLTRLATLGRETLIDLET